jgi:general L-amino acid transport system permease protein
VTVVPARDGSRGTGASVLRGVLVQGATLGAVAVALWWLGHNTLATLQEHDVPLGFGFLRQPANFDIGDTGGLEFGPQDSIGRAIVVGLANTLRVAALGCVLAVLCGFLLGILRLVANPMVRGVARAIVEVMRNTPLLLLLLFLDATIRQLPGPREALHPLSGVFISNRGLALPWFALSTGTLDLPRLAGFNFVGGWTLSPEFAALLAALVLHHAAHISEVVRGAMLAVPRGQQEAARALGLSSFQMLRLVTVPQALRAMVPLLVTSCVSLVKNSSLAVAIGFPDLVSVLNTTGNQTGRNIESMLIMIVVYLTVSLGVAVLLGRYNARILRRVA